MAKVKARKPAKQPAHAKPVVKARPAAKAKPAAKKPTPKSKPATVKADAEATAKAVAPTPESKPATAKPTAKAKPVRKPRLLTVASVMGDALEVKDPIERARMIEAKLDTISDPGGLMKTWFEASLGVPGRREITGENALALCHVRSTNASFLDAVGRELARRNFTNEAIEVFRMAIAAGSTNDTSRMFLGYLLLSQDNAEGVPFLEQSLESFPGWGLPRETLGRWYVKTDPARALVVLYTPQDGIEHELRAMAYEALGRPDGALLESEEALARFDNRVEAHRRLTEFHSTSRHKARAFVHARELFALVESDVEIADADINSIETAIVRAYREAGQLGELLPWLNKLPSMSMDVAWYVHFGLGAMHPNPDPELAIRAAHAIVEVMRARDDESQARVWLVRAAGVAAKHGNVQPLEELVAGGLEDDANAWIEVGNCYMASDDYDAAGAAADRALLLDPSSAAALVMMCRLAMNLGDGDMLHRVAMALLAGKPAWHEGPEFLARSFARRLDVEAALMHSARSLEMAAYCHNAWTARAEALVVSGDLATARTCVERSLEIRAGEPGDDVLIIGAALAGDPVTLEAELAYKFRHLPALPFTGFVACLRRIAG